MPGALYRFLSRVKSLTEHLWFEVPSRRGFVGCAVDGGQWAVGASEK
jgi:hypothetical protein